MKKIDIYLKNQYGKFDYYCSTTYAKTCKAAKDRFLRIHYYLDNSQVKANFAKDI